MNFTSKNVSMTEYSGRWNRTKEDVLTAELVLLTILALCIVFGNILVCAAFAMERKLQTTTNRFVVSLACSDILVGVIIIPLYIYIKTARFALDHMTYEAAWMSLEITTCSSSVASLVAISIERCISVTMPAFHRNISRRAVHATIALVWVHSVFLSGSLIYFYAGKKRQPWMALYRTMVSFFLPLIVILVAYGFILKVAITRGRRRNARLAKDLRLAVTIAIVIGAFSISWLPFQTMTIVAAYYPAATIDWGLALVLVKWLQYLNSMINPIIYSYWNQDFRSTFQKLLRCSKRRGPTTFHQHRDRDHVTCVGNRAVNAKGRKPGKELGTSSNELVSTV